jgi:hypothetical protein
MTDDITATFTIEEFGLLREGLDRLHFFGGKLVRAEAWELIKKIDTLQPRSEFVSRHWPREVPAAPMVSS